MKSRYTQFYDLSIGFLEDKLHKTEVCDSEIYS